MPKVSLELDLEIEKLETLLRIFIGVLEKSENSVKVKRIEINVLNQ